MASRQRNQPQQSSNNDDISLQNLNVAYEEDEYGYVDTRNKRISKELFDQLPSRDFNTVDRSCTKEELSDHTLRRRYSQYRSLQLKNCSLTSYQDPNVDIDRIYELLNSDPEASEEDKIQTLREMHYSLTIKRQIKEKLDVDTRRRRASKVLDTFTRLKLRTNMVWYKFWFELKNKLYSVELWHTPIKHIQGKFGSGVASYFIFLRWLLYINIFNLLVYMFFLLIPQLAYEYSELYVGNSTRENFSISDLITGSGWLTESIMYFGHYSHEVIELIPGCYYNMPLAYLLTVGINFIINLIAVAYSLTSSYQKNYIDMAGDIKHNFCNKIFCAWDYSIETAEAADLRKSAFCNEIKELLSFIRREEKEKTLSEKIIQGMWMILFNIICLAVAALVAYGVFAILDQKAFESVAIKILQEMTLSLTVTFISVTSYFILKYCTKLEFYLNTKTKLYLTMIRVMILRTAMLGVVVYFWMNVNSSEKKSSGCYETELGKEIFRLILVNFLVAVIFLSFFGEYIRRLLSTRAFTHVQRSEFDIAYNTLDLIYYQTLAWIGALCIPMAPLLITMILILLFYVKLTSALYNCRPPKRTWSVNEAQMFFLILTFFMFLGSAFAVGYVIFVLPPSICGPFKEYDHVGDLMHIFTQKGEKHEASEFVKYVSSPGVMFAFFCALCVIVYYMRAQAKAHISVVQKLREQLIMEGKDKVFLLRLFDDALAIQAQVASGSQASGRKETPPKGNTSTSANANILVNETYSEYYDHPPNSPLRKMHEPGYIPANVPVNQKLFTAGKGYICSTPEIGSRVRSPPNSGDNELSVRRPKGIHIPPHQPGFRYFQNEESPKNYNELY